jgi:hypothetical protein
MSGTAQDRDRRIAAWIRLDGDDALPPDLLPRLLRRARVEPQRVPARVRWLRVPTGRRDPRVMWPVAIGLAIAIAIPVAALLLTRPPAPSVVVGPTRSPSSSPGGSAAPTATPVPSATAAPSAEPSATPTVAPEPTPIIHRASVLGFSVEQPADTPPWSNDLYAPSTAGDRTVLTFPDGEHAGGDVWTHFIIVCVGTPTEGAIVEAAPAPASSGTPAADLRRLYRSTLPAFSRAYTDATGGTPVPGVSTVGGEPAITVERPYGLTRAVLVMHHGRAYVIATTGFLGPAVAPHFAEFLASFTFLD